MGARVEPILDDDLAAVGRFLHENMNSRIPPEAWEQALGNDWGARWPNHGFMLKDGNRLVGVYGAIYSERTIQGRTERFCNLAAWSVLPEYRMHSLSLVRALLSQDGFHFTDLSPKPHVTKIMQLLKFEFLDTTWVVVPNLPWRTGSSTTSIITDSAVIERRLSGADLRIYEDHRDLGSLRHLLINDGDEACYVIFHRNRRKGIPTATVLHATDVEVLSRNYRLLGGHFLVREQAVLTIYEAHHILGSPLLSFRTESPHRKMYRSDTLTAEDIDNLYSELVCLTVPGGGSVPASRRPTSLR